MGDGVEKIGTAAGSALGGTGVSANGVDAGVLVAAGEQEHSRNRNPHNIPALTTCVAR